jgi:PAT family beta-lactamase induction signal transducer AmpG
MPVASPAPSAKPRHPLFWVPSLYLAMGIPNVTVGVVSAIVYKNMGVSNSDIALYTSQIYLPWVLKPFWAPLLESFATKKSWVLAMEFLMALSLGLVAFSLPLPGFFSMSLAFFWVTGFASATQDIAADAVYMTTLSPKEQARYCGIQGMCWNMGSVLASGLLVWLTGFLHETLGYGWIKSWVIVMAMIGGFMALLGIWHLRILPTGELPASTKGSLRKTWKTTLETWTTFFQKKSIWMMLLVVFVYRFGEGFIEKFGPLFLIDPRSAGGLGLSNQALGNIYGTMGTIGFIAGALLGGFFSARMTLRRSFVFLALALNVPHLTYFFLSQTLPDNLTLIAIVVMIEKFGFGFGSIGHMLYMMQQIAPGPFKMSHYAMATGVMALTRWSTGTASGFLYEYCHRDYRLFFICMLAASLPPIIISWFAPFPIAEYEDTSAKAKS